ncbi:MAG: isocitrate/isopropylmalate family dehydrogenase [Alphaproteobacteria bacterium]
MPKSVLTRRGVDRAMTLAFDRARTRRPDVTSATTSAGIIRTTPHQGERFAIIKARGADIQSGLDHLDALTAHVVQPPDWFDDLAFTRLRDILLDLGPAGGIGLAAGANLDPERLFPAMFEPVPGSAADIAGRDTASPIGALGRAAQASTMDVASGGGRRGGGVV